MRAVWAAISGLLVEDASLALGIVAALAISGLVATVLGDAARGFVGWLLLAMLTVLIVLDLHGTGRQVRKRMSTPHR